MNYGLRTTIYSSIIISVLVLIITIGPITKDHHYTLD